MFETAITILELNLKHYKDMMEEDLYWRKRQLRKGRHWFKKGTKFVKSDVKYVKARKPCKNEVEIAENWALIGAKMAWEHKIQDISDAIDLLKGLNEEEFNGPDENWKDDPPKSSVQEQGEAKNEGELLT